MPMKIAPIWTQSRRSYSIRWGVEDKSVSVGPFLFLQDKGDKTFSYAFSTHISNEIKLNPTETCEPARPSVALLSLRCAFVCNAFPQLYAGRRF